MRKFFYTKHVQASLEIYRRLSLGFMIGIGEEGCPNNCWISLYLGLVGFYFSLESNWFRWFLKPIYKFNPFFWKKKSGWESGGKETGIDLYWYGGLWIKLMFHAHTINASSGELVIFISNRLADLFLGKVKYTTEDIEEREVLIPMPEKCYKGTAKLFDSFWKRPLWLTKKIRRIDIEVKEGIPHQGKGENSWDCGDDATFGICCPAKNIPEGVGYLVGNVLHDRVRYGGWNDWLWKREKKEASVEAINGRG